MCKISLVLTPGISILVRYVFKCTVLVMMLPDAWLFLHKHIFETFTEKQKKGNPFHVAHPENLHCCITVRPYSLTGMSFLKKKNNQKTIL